MYSTDDQLMLVITIIAVTGFAECHMLVKWTTEVQWWRWKGS